MSVVLHTFGTKCLLHTNGIFSKSNVSKPPCLLELFSPDISVETLHLQGFSSDMPGQMPHVAWRIKWRNHTKSPSYSFFSFSSYIYIYIYIHTHTYIYTHTHTHFYVFTFGCAGSSWLLGHFSSCSERGFSLRWSLLLRSMGSWACGLQHLQQCGLSSCGPRALEQRLGSCGARA